MSSPCGAANSLKCWQKPQAQAFAVPSVHFVGWNGWIFFCYFRSFLLVPLARAAGVAGGCTAMHSCNCNQPATTTNSVLAISKYATVTSNKKKWLTLFGLHAWRVCEHTKCTKPLGFPFAQAGLRTHCSAASLSKVSLVPTRPTVHDAL